MSGTRERRPLASRDAPPGALETEGGEGAAPGEVDNARLDAFVDAEVGAEVGVEAEAPRERSAGARQEKEK